MVAILSQNCPDPSKPPCPPPSRPGCPDPSKPTGQNRSAAGGGLLVLKHELRQILADVIR